MVTVKAVDLLHKNLSHTQYCKWMLKGNKMTEFGKAIHNDHDTIEPMRLREALNEVHGDRLPRRGRYREGLQQAWIARPIRFGLLTSRTSGDKVMHIRLQSGLGK